MYEVTARGAFDASRSNIRKGIILDKLNVKSIQGSRTNVGAYVSLEEATWENINLLESTIEEKLWLSGCPENNRREINLRNAHVNGISDTGECVWENIDSDFFG